MDDDLCTRPATELAALLRDRVVSARELMDAHLDRIERLNPDLNAIVTLDADGARAAADAADARLLATTTAEPVSVVRLRAVLRRAGFHVEQIGGTELVLVVPAAAAAGRT